MLLMRSLMTQTLTYTSVSDEVAAKVSRSKATKWTEDKGLD